jgi:hypothetical protein
MRYLFVILVGVLGLSDPSLGQGGNPPVSDQPGAMKEGGILGPGPQLPKLRTVPSVGDCAPRDADNLVIVGACCNNQPCNGQCVQTETNQIACSCYGVEGGCAPGLVCCRFRRGCYKPEECQLP